MMTCISENKEWIFSGIGLTVLSGLIAVVRLIVKRLVHNYQLRNIFLLKNLTKSFCQTVQ